jgi:hypothetical protein
LDTLFRHCGGHLQSAYIDHPTHPSPHTTVIVAVFEARIPSAPSVARQAATSVRALLKQSPTSEARTHLAAVLTALECRACDPAAVQHEDADLRMRSADLERALVTEHGVAVYTYPHYWRHPYVAGTERHLLNVTRADPETLMRASQTPEEPLLLRIYVGQDERSFHRLLEAADHARGREWFATTLEFCDEIAAALGLRILEV